MQKEPAAAPLESSGVLPSSSLESYDESTEESPQIKEIEDLMNKMFDLNARCKNEQESLHKLKKSIEILSMDQLLKYQQKLAKSEIIIKKLPDFKKNSHIENLYQTMKEA